METPFVIGKTYWLPFVNPHQVTVACPICAGNKVVTVIDGYGKSWSVECDGCGLGYERARGWVNEYSYESGAAQFTIKEVTSMHDDRWWLRSETGQIAEWKDLRETEDEALVISRKSMQEVIDENARRSATTKQAMLKKKTWTVRYHNDNIREYERKIAWHRSKVSPNS